MRAFGPAAEVAAAFDAEVATRRGLRSTLAAAAGVVAVGGSTLALIHAASPDAQAPLGWAVAFFVAAQIAGVAATLAVLQALTARRTTMTPAQLALLARRNSCAVLAAAATMLAAGGGVAGRGSAVALLAGPAVAAGAMIAVLRARALARRLGGARERVLRPPLEDLARLTGLGLPALPAPHLLALGAVAAAAAAFMRDRAEHAAALPALGVAGIEAAAVVAGFALLGPALGLWRRR